MRALKIMMAVMGVLIIAGVIGLGIAISQRMAGPRIAAVVPPLDEPAGTRIVQISAAGDRLSLLLQGGGPDRIVVLDLAHPGATYRTGLSH